MVRFIRVAAAVLCVLCVLAICIAPLVDLPDTKLRSDNLIVLLLCFFAVAAISFLKAFETFDHTNRSIGIWLPSSRRKIPYALLPLDTNSILRR
jgi:hypothetical protein